MARKFLTAIDLNKNELQNFAFQKLASAPGSPAEAQAYYDTDDDSLYLKAASAWFKFLDARDILDADDMTGASATNVPSAESVVAYVNSRLLGLTWGTPVRLVATTNVTLASGLANGQTLDGVTIATGDRILLTNQTDPTQNGIYIAPASGTASRSSETGAQLANHLFLVQQGTTYHDTTWSINNDTITLGSTSITIVQTGAGTAPDASTTVKGIVELATVAEAEAKTDAARAVTPAGLATFTRKYTADFTSSTGATITAATHGLGATKALQVAIYEDGSPNVLVDTDVSVADNGDVTWASNTVISGHIVIIG